MSYIEIYNEQIRDLLAPGAESLMLVEDAERGISVSGLTETDISDCTELVKLLVVGNTRRVKAATRFNQVSSRSHALILINVEKTARAVQNT
jgi:hypothetical protein